MQISKKSLLLLLAFVPAAPGVAEQPPIEAVPQEVIAAAEEGLRYFLSTIPVTERSKLGFEGTDKDLQSTLGSPFRQYTIKPEDILGYRSGDDIASMVRAQDIWNFPILSDGKARCILSVTRMAGHWKAVNLGQAPLAAEVDAVSQYWQKSKGYNLRYVRIYQANSEIFLLTTAELSRIVPFRTTAVALGFAEKGQEFRYRPIDAPVLIKSIVSIVEANLGSHEIDQ